MGLCSKLKYVVVIIAAVLFYQWLNRLPHKLPMLYGGEVEPKFKTIEDVFRSNFESGLEAAGATFAVMHKGKLVVDLWGGYSDVEAGRPWDRDTISVVMSTTKAVASACIAILVDRGLLDYEALVTKYWPEFDKDGRGNLTVRMFVSHTAGLAAIDKKLEIEMLKDWKKMSQLLEDQEPNWPPGTQIGYHALTHGFLLEQLVRRVDPRGRSLGTFFKEEVADKHGIDFHIGLPKEEFHRVARHVKSPLQYFVKLLVKSREYRNFMYLMLIASGGKSPHVVEKLLNTATWYIDDVKGIVGCNRPEALEVEIPAANGVGNSRALVKFFHLFDSGVLVSTKTLEHIRHPSVSESEELPAAYFPGLARYAGLGFMHTKTPSGNFAYGHPGYGGQHVKVDPENQLVYAYTSNAYTPDMGSFATRFNHLEKALYDIVLN